MTIEDEDAELNSTLFNVACVLIFLLFLQRHTDCNGNWFSRVLHGNLSGRSATPDAGTVKPTAPPAPAITVPDGVTIPNEYLCPITLEIMQGELISPETINPQQHAQFNVAKSVAQHIMGLTRELALSAECLMALQLFTATVPSFVSMLCIYPTRSFARYADE
jgi:hypothetical protein